MPLPQGHKGRMILLHIEAYTKLEQGDLSPPALVQLKSEHFKKIIEKIYTILEKNWTSGEVHDFYFAVLEFVEEYKTKIAEKKATEQMETIEFVQMIDTFKNLGIFTGAIYLVYMILREKEGKVEEENEASERAKIIYQEVVKYVKLFYKEPPSLKRNGQELDTFQKLIETIEIPVNENWPPLEVEVLLRKIIDLDENLRDEISKAKKVDKAKIELISDVGLFMGTLRLTLRLAREREAENKSAKIS